MIGESFVSKLMDNLAELLPVRIVHDYEQGVLFSMGKSKKLCTSSNGISGTGVHVFWPFFQSMVIDETLERIVDLSRQTIGAVTVQGSVGYCIYDLKKVWENLYDYEESLLNVTEGIIAANADDLSDPDAILGVIAAHTYPWGIEITKFYLPVHTSAMNIRLIGD